MLNFKTQAEVYVYGLIHGLVLGEEVLKWAELILSESTNPENWVLDLCSSDGKNTKELITILHLVPGLSDNKAANSAIADILSRKSKPFELFSKNILPQSFEYPDQFIEYAKTGQYLYSPAISFIDASSSYAISLLGHVQEVSQSYVPFAQLDERFCCFDAENENKVFIVNIVEKKSALLGSHEWWFKNYAEEAKSEWRYVGT